MTHARPFHILTQDCPPNTMVEQKLLKGLKTEEKSLRNLGVDKLLVS